jgi:hypothetical protein
MSAATLAQGGRMSAAGEAQAQDTFASGAKPRPEGRVRERGWRPTPEGYVIGKQRAEAARRRAMPKGRHADICIAKWAEGGRG